MKKLLISLVLIFLISFSSVKAYAYYEDAQTMYVSDTRPQVLLEQTLVTEEHKQLVPMGAILGVDDVEEVVFTYKVFVKNGLELELQVDNMLFNGQKQSAVDGLFNHDFTIEILEEDTLQTSLFENAEDGYYVEITLVVSMNAPTTEQYQLIANNMMTFDVLFKAI